MSEQRDMTGEGETQNTRALREQKRKKEGWGKRRMKKICCTKSAEHNVLYFI